MVATEAAIYRSGLMTLVINHTVVTAPLSLSGGGIDASITSNEMQQASFRHTILGSYTRAIFSHNLMYFNLDFEWVIIFRFTKFQM